MIATTLRRALAAALVLFIAGCAQTFDATTLGVPASLASDAGQQPTGEAFSVTTHSVHGFWGLMKFRSPSVERALAGQLLDGQAISNVRIKVRSSVTDVIFTILTAGLVVPRSVTVEGVVTGP
ncbi:MAG TPA: hypothetical protein VFS94_11810 [Gemmatimonadales bacterium]|nr:hypothetical protein [Gemmatimonadales bacterium]